MVSEHLMHKWACTCPRFLYSASWHVLGYLMGVYCIAKDHIEMRYSEERSHLDNN